jgi:hypothetical protein
MTLAVITQGEVLTVRSYKQYMGYLWANNYEVEATQDITNPSTALEFLATRIVELERGLHLSAIVIDRVAISTYVPDSQPYNPSTIAVFPFSVNATKTPQGTAQPLEVCLFVRRSVVFGRDGRLLYRGCLTTSEVSSGNLRASLTSAALGVYQGIINSWRTVGLGNEFRFVLASGLPVPTDVRPVQTLQVSEKVVFKKLNNRYFRRNP